MQYIFIEDPGNDVFSILFYLTFTRTIGKQPVLLVIKSKILQNCIQLSLKLSDT